VDQLNKLTETYKRLFSGPDGETVLNDLLKFCHFMQPTFVAESPCETSFNEGKRRVALRILSYLNRKDLDLVQTIYNGE
jgi:hypothetical protein